MDDGTRTVFRWLAAGATPGLRRASGHPLYHGPGRGPANSLNALVDGYQLTARAQISRQGGADHQACHAPARRHRSSTTCSMPNVNGSTRCSSRRWAEYLDVKVERRRARRACMPGHALASCTTRGGWQITSIHISTSRRCWSFRRRRGRLRTSERATSFITRKSHASDPAERARFRDHAGFFFDNSIKTLTAAPTRALARPVIVLLTSGRLHAWFQRHPEATGPPVPEVPGGFGMPADLRAAKSARLSSRQVDHRNGRSCRRGSLGRARVAAALNRAAISDQRRWPSERLCQRFRAVPS